jgi:hypothetical protein
MSEGDNDRRQLVSTGCKTTRENGVERPLTSSEVKSLGCRPRDVIDEGFVADRTPPRTFTDANGTQRLERAHRTTRNQVTAWWDGSQIYGFDETSRRRVKRDPLDRAKLLMVPTEDGSASGRRFGLSARDDGRRSQNAVWRARSPWDFRTTIRRA